MLFVTLLRIGHFSKDYLEDLITDTISFEQRRYVTDKQHELPFRSLPMFTYNVLPDEIPVNPEDLHLFLCLKS